MTKRKRQFHEFYMNVAVNTALLSRCNRRKVGAIIVKDGNILSYGFNGTPSKFCNDCEDENNITKKIVLHAESNALMKCVKTGNPTKNSSLYVSTMPCIECAKLIIQAGIVEVFYKDEYHNQEGLKLLNDAGIKACKI